MEIIPNVHLIPGMRGANAYLLLGSTLTLVDTGMPGSADTILAYIEGLGLSVADLAYIVITHYHLDHVGSLAAIKARTSAQALSHPGDAPFISGEQSPPPAPSAIMRFLFWLVAPLMPTPDPVSVDLTVQDDDRLDTFAALGAGPLGGATVVHVPGHTPGSIALHFPSERLLICGDTIDHRRGRLGPPPKPFTDDMDQAIASMRRMAELEFDVLCPGHGLPIVGRADEQVRAMVQSFD
jgi:glyoxylase-like metal-dependent hydrolase (beta-lactamase superfamily II)